MAADKYPKISIIIGSYNNEADDRGMPQIHFGA